MRQKCVPCEWPLSRQDVRYRTKLKVEYSKKVNTAAAAVAAEKAEEEKP